MKGKMRYSEYVTSQLTKRDLLEQLAEEASELSHAALKLIRAAKYSDNATPIAPGEAIDNLTEEFYDTFNAWLLLVSKDKGIQDKATEYLANSSWHKKLERWAERLGYGEE